MGVCWRAVSPTLAACMVVVALGGMLVGVRAAHGRLDADAGRAQMTPSRRLLVFGGIVLAVARHALWLALRALCGTPDPGSHGRLADGGLC